MAFRYNPRIKIGRATFGKRGVSIRTGIPGLTFRAAYPGKSSGQGSTAAHEAEDPHQPTQSIGGLIWSLVKFSALCILTVGFFGAFSFWLGAILGAILLFAYAYPSLSGGEEYTDHERLLTRIKGAGQVFITGLALMLLWFGHDAADKQARSGPAHLNAPVSIKGLTVGSTLAQIKQQEGRKLSSLGDDWYYVDPATYANEKGELTYRLTAGRINSIKFEINDTAAYRRLAKLLAAKYGPPTSDQGTYQIWLGDSAQVKLKANSLRVWVELERAYQ